MPGQGGGEQPEVGLVAHRRRPAHDKAVVYFVDRHCAAARHRFADFALHHRPGGGGPHADDRVRQTCGVADHLTGVRDLGGCGQPVPPGPR